MHLADSNRQQPGLGHTDFRPALAALKQIGFNGYMALECGIKGERKAAGTKLSSTQHKKFRICMIDLQLYRRLRSGADWPPGSKCILPKPGQPLTAFGGKADMLFCAAHV